jgi:hypothetical protein
MRWLQSQLLFKMFSSAKLAVPVLLLIAAITSYGTILESWYNADYARLVVYDSWWFRLLLLILGLTIFLSTLSRWPWKKRHIGFLVTHLGLITLLIGSVITMKWGIDGQLQVFEGDEENQVRLNEKVFEFSGPREFKKIIVPQAPSAKFESAFSGQNSKIDRFFKIIAYRPFVKEPTSSPQLPPGPLVSFKLQSQFFDQEEWLHETERPELQMGPALIKLIREEEGSKKTAKPKGSKPPASGEAIILYDEQGKLLVQKSLAQSRVGFSVGDVQIKVKNTFKYATVNANKISEGDPGTPNPAVEIEFQKNGQTYRDVLFAKFPDFSVLKDNKIGVRAVYQAAVDAAAGESSTSASARNVVEFILPEGAGQPVVLHLLKDGKTVLRQRASLNTPVETPWMGMKITVTKVNTENTENAVAHAPVSVDEEVAAIEPIKKQNFLPPGAIRVLPNESGARPFWLVEGQVKEVTMLNENYQVYYGANTIRLPFSLNLKKFHKVDYPGTETPMTFASDVVISGSTEQITISMNEPLKQDGYTLYQSSYSLIPGRPALSVFSVNKDPGRWVKYLGSVILAVGIIIFTIMRSRLAKKGTPL